MTPKYLVPLVASSLLLPGAASAADTPAEKPAQAPAERKTPAPSLTELRDKLQKLATEQPQATGTTGRAMCYAPPRPPGTISYTCPECNEKTIYAIDPAADDNTAARARIVSVMRVSILRRQTEQLRQLGLPVKLDEKAWCRKCQPAAPQSYSAGMTISWPDGKIHRMATVNSPDLDLLAAFLKGDSMIADAAGRSSPLKDKLPRLQELLGIELK
jgi:hypothetical protein